MNGFASLRLELAVIVLLDVAAVLISAALDRPAWQELGALALVGSASALWLAVRVRRLAARLEARDGAKQE